jgi:hypothetical protein
MSAEVVQSPWEIRQLLQRAIDEEADAQVQWGTTQDTGRSKVLGAMPDASPDRLVLQAPAFPQGFQAPPDVSCKALITLRNRSLLGVLARFEIREDRWELHWPERVVRIQRRGALRWQIPPGYEIHVTLDNPEGTSGAPARTVKRLADLGQKGLSFALLSAREASLYAVGKRFANCELVLRGDRIAFEGEVRSHRTLTRPDGSRMNVVGMKFTAMDRQHAEFLEEFVRNALLQHAL